MASTSSSPTTENYDEIEKPVSDPEEAEMPQPRSPLKELFDKFNDLPMELKQEQALKDGEPSDIVEEDPCPYSSTDDPTTDTDATWFALNLEESVDQDLSSEFESVTNEELILRFREVTARLKNFVTPRTSLQLDKQGERFEEIVNGIGKSRDKDQDEDELSPRDNEFRILQELEASDSDDDDLSETDEDPELTAQNTEERLLNLNLELAEWDDYYCRMSDETKRRFCALKAKVHAITAILNIQKASELKLNGTAKESDTETETSEESPEDKETPISFQPSTSTASLNKDADNAENVCNVDSAMDIVRIIEKVKARRNAMKKFRPLDEKMCNSNDDEQDSDYKSVQSYDSDTDWKSCCDSDRSDKEISDLPRYNGCACMLPTYRYFVKESVNQTKKIKEKQSKKETFR